MAVKRKKQHRATNGAVLAGIVCENIRHLRQKQKMSLNQFSQKVGFTASYIWVIEHRSKGTMSVSTLERFAKAFKIDPRKFLVKHGV